MNRLLNTFRYTFLSLRGQIIGWGLGIAFLGLLIVSFYGVFMERQADFMQLVESYPPEFLAFFGGDAASLLTPEGYLGMYGFSMLPLIVGIFAVIVGSRLLAGDEERGRLDLILSHPVGRSAFFFGRLLAFLAATIVLLFVGWLGFSRHCSGPTWGSTGARWPAIPRFWHSFDLRNTGLAAQHAPALPKPGASVSGLFMATSYF
jgi:ABC-type transport system involved in multi-copper enzyme maturation permease subunit